ncbi:MAG TPA: hypothetical protein EYH02_00495 [Ignisphaera aggregans]|uniref:Uncharacterized protein n=1 Tax=Ignisphaera aggregans TaxID=334771 RepID=A0A832YYD9_9CREN|nr:hypothetical protein [Ignisphaera aggregans]
MRSTLEAVLEYLVAKALADKLDVVQALYDYFVNGVSPSVLAVRYGLSKHQIRGYIQRITEKTGSLTRARIVIKYATPFILRVRPVMKRVGENLVKCMVCGDELPIQVAEDHIKKYHSTLLSEYIGAVIELMRRELRASREGIEHSKVSESVK